MNAVYVTLRHRKSTKCGLKLPVSMQRPVKQIPLLSAAFLDSSIPQNLPTNNQSTFLTLHHHTNTFTMAARSRLPLIAGLGAATFGGYYMYRAGGSPKVAEKQMERM